MDELSYQEVDRTKYLRPVVEAFIADYNEQNKSSQINTPMFDFMIE